MSKFVRNGGTFQVASNAALDVYEELPTATYTVRFDIQTGFFLEVVEGYELKGKIYGDTLKHADRILATFDARDNSTGVLLSGEKGSGKTLLAKKISLLGQDMGFPTLVINQPWCGELFNVFIQTITQPVVVIFDEFEKVYNDEQQEALLTLLDGVYPSKKLFVITCNERHRVNSHMMNRPGRIFYRLDYAGLDRAFVLEYAKDNLKNMEHLEELGQVVEMFAKLNFDILKAIVEEMNRYDESPREAMKMLNAKPDSTNETFKFTLEVDGKVVDKDDLSNEDTLRTSAVGLEVNLGYRSEEVDEDDDRIWKYEMFTASNMKTAANGTFIYVNEGGSKLTLRRFQRDKFNWDSVGYAV